MASPTNVDIAEQLLDEFVAVANKAVDEAGEVIRKYYRNPQAMKTMDKRDENGCITEQVTAADVASEERIVSILLKHFPDHVIYGEESGWVMPKNKLADFVWVIDPIDGTTSFKNGLPLFGTLVALLYKSKPIIGIIDQPILKDRWVGVQGRITTLNGVNTHTRSCEELSRATLYSCSPLHFSDEEYKAFTRVTDKVQEPLYGAECLTYGLLASGFNDLIIQSFLGPYDFLAFIPIIEGAGGVITDWKGEKLYWEASPLFEAPSYYRIIAAGDERVHKSALDYLNA
ncbi:bifunctional phosphatase IMPL2, chloroplastic-like [Silene latifolia]|uniref:bifunctional phosphatase IMPL2, chloroplastic-like n=1 Tax=Silene latifolia TaxID=37657 RepID=UPI003D779B0A